MGLALLSHLKGEETQVKKSCLKKAVERDS
jgi:hypothetical protein